MNMNPKHEQEVAAWRKRLKALEEHAEEVRGIIKELESDAV